MIWTLLFFGITVFFLSRKVFPRIQEALDKRAKLIAESIEAAEQSKTEAEQLPLLMDFAFLALHGPGGEDGAIQGLLEWLGIPYSGSGILPSAFGIDKIAQKNLLKALGRPTPDFRVIKAEEWDTTNHAATRSARSRDSCAASVARERAVAAEKSTKPRIPSAARTRSA